jgi:hypothetical protein
MTGAYSNMHSVAVVSVFKDIYIVVVDVRLQHNGFSLRASCAAAETAVGPKESQAGKLLTLTGLHFGIQIFVFEIVVVGLWSKT